MISLFTRVSGEPGPGQQNPKPKGDGKQATHLARKPYKLEYAYVDWLARRADGNPAIPTPKEIDEAKRPREHESQQEAIVRVMGKFTGTVAHTERRTTAAITASGFALTLSGLLIHDKHVISPGYLVAAIAFAFSGMVIGLFGQAIHLGDPIARELTNEDLTTALYSYTRKEARAQLALLSSGLALLAFIVGFTLTHHWT
jgi:hypothetical protein